LFLCLGQSLDSSTNSLQASSRQANPEKKSKISNGARKLGEQITYSHILENIGMSLEESNQKVEELIEG